MLIASDGWVLATFSLTFLSGNPLLLLTDSYADTKGAELDHRWYEPWILVSLQLAALALYRRLGNWRLAPCLALHVLCYAQLLLSLAAVNVCVADRLPVSPHVIEGGKIVLVLVCALLGGVLPRVLAPFTLPRPSGPFQSVAFADVPMRAGSSNGHNHNPHAYFRVYYPAGTEPLAAERFASWASHARSIDGYAHFTRFPRFLFWHLLESRVPAYRDQRLAVAPPEHCAARYPVYLFSHGLGGAPECYAAHAIDVASHGYLVVVPHHHDRSAAWRLDEHGAFELYTRLTPAQLADKALEFDARSRQVHERAAELKASFDRLAGVEALRTVADLSRGCVLAGHSFGAATACLAAALGQLPVRCLVVVDVWMLPLGDDRAQPLPAALPSLDIQSDQWLAWTPNYNSSRRLAASRSVTIRGSRHSSFSDFAFLSPWLMRKLQVIGASRPESVMQEWTELVLQFAREH